MYLRIALSERLPVFLVCIQAQKLAEPVVNILTKAEIIRNKQIILERSPQIRFSVLKQT